MKNKPCWNSKSMGMNLAHNIRILRIKSKKKFFASWLSSVKFTFFFNVFCGKWVWHPPDHATPLFFCLQIARSQAFCLCIVCFCTSNHSLRILKKYRGNDITLRRLWKLYHFEKYSQAFFNILTEPLLVQKQTMHQQKA